MPSGVTWQVDTGLKAKPPAKQATPKKSKPKPPPKKTEAPKFVKGRGLNSNPVEQAKSNFDFSSALRRAVAPPVDAWNAVRPYTPAPTVEKAVKKATPAPARGVARAASVLDRAAAAQAEIEGNILHGRKPWSGVSLDKTIGQLAAEVSNPLPHYKVGTAELSAPYKQYFKGQTHVTQDQIQKAAQYFNSHAPGGSAPPYPFTEEEAVRKLLSAKKNGWDINDADHWTPDDLVIKSIQKNEKSLGGFARHVAGGFLQLGGIPSSSLAAGGALIAAAGGNTKPAKATGQELLDYTRNTLPFVGKKSFFNEVYENPVGVAANLLPIAKGASSLAGKAALTAGERDIRMPGMSQVKPTVYTSHVPADVISRALHETRRNLIERAPGRRGPLADIGSGLERRIERNTYDVERELAQLKRDAGSQEARRNLHKATRETTQAEGRLPSLGPANQIVQPGRLSGGRQRVMQITESTRTGMSPAVYTQWRKTLVDDALTMQRMALEKAQEHRAKAEALDAEGDLQGAVNERNRAHQAEVDARHAHEAARTNQALSNLMEGGRDVPPDHPLRQALIAASNHISDIRQELSKHDEQGNITGGLSNRARVFGDAEALIRASARDLGDSALHEAARSSDTATAQTAQIRLRRAEEANNILDLRRQEEDLRKRADARRRGEDTSGRSHAARESLGGLSELERTSDRQIAHIDKESDKLHAAQQRLGERTAKVQEPTGRPTVSTEPAVDAAEVARRQGHVTAYEQRLAEHNAQAAPKSFKAPRATKPDEARMDEIVQQLRTGDSDLAAHPEAHIIPFLRNAEARGVPVADAFAAYGRRAGLDRKAMLQVLKNANARELRIHEGARTFIENDLAQARTHLEHAQGRRQRTETPAEAPKPRHPIEVAPRVKPAGMSESEHAHIQQRLQDIAENHIDRERTKRSGTKERIGKVRAFLADESISPERRAGLEAQRDRLIEQFNTPSPRVIRQIERSIDAYLQRFGKRLTAREKRAYKDRLIAQTAKIKQAKGDLTAMSRRERMRERVVVREQERSSGALRTQAERVGQQYEEALNTFTRRHGTGAHMTLAQSSIDRGGVRGYLNREGQGIRPKTRQTRIRRTTGEQQLKGQYAADQTLPGVFRDLRTTADQVASLGHYDSLLRTNIVHDAAGLEGTIAPPGWHFVSEENLSRFTSAPGAASSAERTESLIRARAEKGHFKTLLSELRDARAQTQQIIPDQPGFLVRESALQAMEEAVKRHDLGDLNLLDQLTNEYRKVLLFTLPRTFNNNLFGNIGLAITSGAGMRDILTAHHMLMRHPEAIPSSIRHQGWTAQQIGPEAVTGGYMDMWRRANTYAEDLGQLATYVAQLRGYGKTKGLKGSNRAILKGIDDVSSEWYDVMKQLAHGEDPNVIPLMKKSKQFFNSFTGAHKALASTILFHRWVGHIVRLITVTLPLHYPGRFALLMEMGQLGDDYRKHHGVLPDWAVGVVKLATDHVKTPGGVQDVITGLSTTGVMPAQTLTQVADLGTDSNPVFPGMAIAGGALSPLIGVPFQAATGINLQTGRAFTDRYGNPVGPGQIPQLAGHLLWANAPLISTAVSTAGTSADSQLWNQAPAATSPSAYRRQQASPYMVHAHSPKDWWSVILRSAGVPITQFDSYGPRYNQHLAALAGAIQKTEVNKHNKDLKPVAPAPAPKKRTGPPPKASKPLTPAQQKAKQKAYAQKVKAGSSGQSAADIKAKQKAYAEKVRSGG